MSLEIEDEDASCVVVWNSAPTTFVRAAIAWAAAAEAAASPLFPPEFTAVIRSHSYWYEHHEPEEEDLQALADEALRRAEWLPRGNHFVPLARPSLWRSRNQYGLCWRSSVDTILARTRAGWVVRIVGEHDLRRRAAEHELGPEGVL